MTNVKKVDFALLPPCAKTVHNKMQRAHFISILWGNADSAHPGNGVGSSELRMERKNGYYTWFFGPALPDYLFMKGNKKRIV